MVNFELFLSQEALVTVAYAFVKPRIVYSNSLLHGIANYSINHLQRIQNGAPRKWTCQLPHHFYEQMFRDGMINLKVSRDQ